MDKRIYNVSSVRLMRYLYALGFNKESYYDKNGKENWRFEINDYLTESLKFYHDMRNKNKNRSW